MRNLKNKDLNELEALASGFSGYAGAPEADDIHSYENTEYSGYESSEDNWLNYGDSNIGIQSLLHPKKSKTIFKFTLTNSDTSNTKTAILNAPDYQQGRIVEGSFKSEDGSDVMSAAGKRKTIDEFNSIMRDEPGLVSLMDLRCSDTSQFQEVMTYVTRAFSKNDDEEFIDPQDYESKNQQNANFIEVQFPYILGPDNWLKIPVLPDTTVTFTLWYTVLGNRSASFMSKVKEKLALARG